MTWENILKEMTLDEIEEIVGKTGSLDELIEMIEKKFAVKTKMISSSSSSPIIGFDLPIYISLEMVGSKTEEFEIVSTGVQK
tara:strand:+ start:866 stop:1111 length:246 start_codon:yes stop_codon:yes gene_type:complete